MLAGELPALKSTKVTASWEEGYLYQQLRPVRTLLKVHIYVVGGETKGDVLSGQRSNTSPLSKHNRVGLLTFSWALMLDIY